MMFLSHFCGRKFQFARSEHVCEVAPARVQGLVNNLEYFRMRGPKIFEDGSKVDYWSIALGLKSAASGDDVVSDQIAGRDKSAGPDSESLEEHSVISLEDFCQLSKQEEQRDETTKQPAVDEWATTDEEDQSDDSSSDSGSCSTDLS